MSFIKYVKRVVVDPANVPFSGTQPGASESLNALWQAAKARGDIVGETFSPFEQGGTVQRIRFEFADEAAFNRVQAEIAADPTAVVVSIFTDAEEPVDGPIYWANH